MDDLINLIIPLDLTSIHYQNEKTLKEMGRERNNRIQIKVLKKPLPVSVVKWVEAGKISCFHGKCIGIIQGVFYRYHHGSFHYSKILMTHKPPLKPGN